MRLTSLICAHVGRENSAVLAALAKRPDSLELDFAAVDSLDSAGAAWLTALLRTARGQGCTLPTTNVSPAVGRSLSVFPDRKTPASAPANAPAPLLERLGGSVGQALGLVLETMALLQDLFRFARAALVRPRRSVWRTLLLEMEQVGVQAVFVVGLIAFLVGITVALQSAAQLRQFGANVYVVDLVAVAITRELGPLMAAIVVAGRSGAAAAAEIATMVITEEVDALRTMGIHPVRHVVLPKVVAIVATQPLLTVLANAIAIFGSFLVALFYLDISPGTFADRLQQAMVLKDVGLGVVKSATFGLLIMVIAAVVGLRTHGGADAVGRSTTTSVVAAIFAIIVADAAFSLVFYLGD